MNRKKFSKRGARKSAKMSESEFQNRLQNTRMPKFRVKTWINTIPGLPKPPKGPHQGCALSTRQLASTFNTVTGLSNIGGLNSAAQLVQNGATAILGAVAFRMDDLSQSATFASLFDQYRIDKVLLRFTSRSNAVSVFNASAPNSSVPMVYITQDRDDASAPASINALREYDKTVIMNGASSCDVFIEPRPTISAFASGAFSGYVTPDIEPWLDMANTDIPHYGVKFGVCPLTATTTSSWVWDVEAYYYVSFRNIR